MAKRQAGRGRIALLKTPCPGARNVRPRIIKSLGSANGATDSSPVSGRMQQGLSHVSRDVFGGHSGNPPAFRLSCPGGADLPGNRDMGIGMCCFRRTVALPASRARSAPGMPPLAVAVGT